MANPEAFAESKSALKDFQEALPQGQPERGRRVAAMVETMEEYFGSCSNFRECEAVCPKEISVDFIGRMNHEYLRARLSGSD